MRSKTRFIARLRRAVPLVLLSILLWQDGSPNARAQQAMPRAALNAICNRADFRVLVDVGHTAEAPGARSARGAVEYEFNLRLAELIVHKLIDAGFSRSLLLVTGGPKMKSLAERVARANGAAPDLFLSIHHDSVPDSLLEKWEFEGEEHSFNDRFKGHSIFVSYDNVDRGGSLRFGRLLGLALKGRGLQYTPHYTEKIMGHRRRELIDAEVGVYRYDQLIVLKDTHMPAVLLEAGSIINRDEELLMGSPERRSLISTAVTDAVENFCVSRRPRRPDRVTPQPGVSPWLQPAAARGGDGAKTK